VDSTNPILAARRILLPFLAFALALVVTLVLSAVAFAAQTYTLKPAADATAKQAFPNNNYGTATNLGVRYTTTGQGEFSFLRFERPTLAGSVTSASLRVRVTGATQELSFYSVNMNNPTWAENSLTWNSWQTGTTYTYLGSLYNLSSGTYATFDVTSYVGSTNLTFAVASGADAAGQQVASREGSVSPTLTIVTNGTLPTCEPPDLREELIHKIETGNLLYGCDYVKNLSPGFTAWNGGSENQPVAAAAIALFEGPTVNGTDYRTWWSSFFSRQATAPSGSGTSNVDYFKGSELFSNVYDDFTTVSVMAAHYWGWANNYAAVRDPAKTYLKRTFYAWSLGTRTEPVARIFDAEDLQTPLFISPSSYTCATVALASPRSKRTYDYSGSRWVIDQVLGYGKSCNGAADVSLRDLYTLLKLKYSGVSGLTSTDVTALKNLIGSTTLPSDLTSVMGGLRMKGNYHWMLWADGRRATFFEGSQLNNNIKVSGGKGTVFATVYTPSNRDLTVLFNLTTGSQSCLVSSQNRLFIDDLGTAGCSSNDYIDFPTNPTHHFKLGPNGWKVCSSLACP
jgi:hypothetical protein